MTGFPNEEILADDYPVYCDYLYVADGKVYQSVWHGITVEQLKRREGFREVRRCNIFARRRTITDALVNTPQPTRNKHG